MLARVTDTTARRGPRPALAFLAAAACALALAYAGEPGPERDTALRTVAATGELSIVDSAGGGAILTAADMAPGSSVAGTVTIANAGSIDGNLTLDVPTPANVPGRGGGALSPALRLDIDDVTDGAAPVRVYSGPLAGARSLPAGVVRARGDRTLRLAVTLAGGGAEDAYQGARAEVRFDWTATAEDPDAGVVTGGRPGPAPLRIPSGQRPLRRGALSVLTSCEVRCTARLALSVDLPGRGRRVVERAARRLPAGRARVTVRLSRRSLAHIRGRLARGGSARGRITLSVREASGRRLRTSRPVRFVLVRR